MKMKLTKQGVRDLNDLGPKKEARVLPPTCDHRKMRLHCGGHDGRGCGHYVCDGCGMDWDEGFSGPYD